MSLTIKPTRQSNQMVTRDENAPKKIPTAFLTVGLLVARASGGTAELLGLAATGVGHEEVAVVGHEKVLDLTLGGLVHVLLVERHDGLGDCLADSVDLWMGGRQKTSKPRRKCQGALSWLWRAFYSLSLYPRRYKTSSFPRKVLQQKNLWNASSESWRHSWYNNFFPPTSTSPP